VAPAGVTVVRIGTAEQGFHPGRRPHPGETKIGAGLSLREIKSIFLMVVYTKLLKSRLDQIDTILSMQQMTRDLGERNRERKRSNLHHGLMSLSRRPWRRRERG
jgi:hypothetical protein